MFFVYILYSAKLNRYYTGSCADIGVRLQRHNSGYVYATRNGMPWELKYAENFSTRSEAMRRESAIKKRKSRIYIVKLIAQSGGELGGNAPI